MKKKCLECVVLLLFIFALTHGIIQNTQPLKETKEVQTEYGEKTSQVTEKSQETEPEVQIAIARDGNIYIEPITKNILNNI